MKVILIDGPKAGEVLEVPDNQPCIQMGVMCPVGGLYEFMTHELWNSPSFEVATYNIYHVSAGDTRVPFGTVENLTTLTDTPGWCAFLRELNRQAYAVA